MSEITNKIIPVESIVPHPRNSRSHPEAQLSDLGSSLKRFNQYRSVVLWERPDGKYMQVAGHGIVEAMKRGSVCEVRADVLPVNTPQSTIDAIMIADNNIALKSTDDSELLTKLLQEQQNMGFDLASLGSDDETLRQMLEGLEYETRNAMKVAQGRSYEFDEGVIDGENKKLGITVAEALDRYQTTDIRQIMLLYDREEYARILPIFMQIRKEEKLETNTDVVTLLLEQYVQKHELEEVIWKTQ